MKKYRNYAEIQFVPVSAMATTLSVLEAMVFKVDENIHPWTSIHPWLLQHMCTVDSVQTTVYTCTVDSVQSTVYTSTVNSVQTTVYTCTVEQPPALNNSELVCFLTFN